MSADEETRGHASTSDEELMDAIRGGAAEPLQVLLNRHWIRVVQYATRMLDDQDDGQDVAQEVFVRIWEHKTRWKRGHSAVGYMYQIARNLVVDRLRKGKIRTGAAKDIQHHAVPGLTPLETAQQSELVEALEQAVRRLPARRREAFLLVRVQGLSIAEAAEVMGVTPRTVTNHAYMAAAELEEMLRPYRP